MVFIEERNIFLGSLANQPKQLALFALVYQEPYQIPPDIVSEIDTIYYLSVQAINNNSVEGFKAQYSIISKRKVPANSSAPFIHDDFLIFTLIIGLLKFNLEKDWLLEVIRKRANNPTSTTFENLLTENYQSKANNQSIVLASLYLLQKKQISNEYLTEAYKAISTISQNFKSDFIRIIHYRAFDIIIQFKLPRSTDQVSRLLEFETTFKKRIKIFSSLVYNFLLLLVLIGAYALLHSLPEELKLKINELGIVIGIAGIGLIGNAIPKLRILFQKLILRAFGYQNKA